MNRGYVALAVTVVCVIAGGVVLNAGGRLVTTMFYGYAAGELLGRALIATAVVAGFYGAYALIRRFLIRRTPDKVERHKAVSVLQLLFVVLGTLAVLGVVTDRWVPALVSLGVVGFAITFALQQPLLSLFGWLYIMVKEPYQVGDRVAIEGSKGDIIDVDFLVTTLWEVNGELVSSNQPSGRHVTVPNSVVLSTQITNFSRAEFPYVWNEVEVQVAYETDLDFASAQMRAAAEEFLGEEMEEAIAHYRELLEETPVELEVNERPSVNVEPENTFVTLRLRYLVPPKRGQKTKNELYQRIIARFNEHPDRVAFPMGRSR
ncbi:mechanosensitive ion channel family protein [Halarchaeum sp. P4]|uniref:mechanosensitive ion channel family protein n=1 Tax=Halarchaeum sp. P4 TaxID=3421639 RepID=UPI003EBEDFC4